MFYQNSFRERSFEIRQTTRADVSKARIDFKRIQNSVMSHLLELLLLFFFLLNDMFTTLTAYWSRRGRFVNASYLNKNNFAQNLKFIYDKRK